MNRKTHEEHIQKKKYKKLLLDLSELLESGDAKHDYEDAPGAFTVIHILGLIVNNALASVVAHDKMAAILDEIEELKEHDEL